MITVIGNKQRQLQNKKNAADVKTYKGNATRLPTDWLWRALKIKDSKMRLRIQV